VLSLAAEQFCADGCRRPATMAGYPALEVRTRDVLLSLPGLYLVRGRLPAAKRTLGTVLSLQRGGLLCDSLHEAGLRRRSAMPDATLWLFEVARALMKVLPADDEYLKSRLYPALVRAFVRIKSKRRRYVWLSRDGLVANHDDDRPLTWMDAHVGSRLVTPRRGLAVEFQALWSKGCETLAALAHNYGHQNVALAAERACEAARIAFRERFWCNETDYPFDCLSEARDSADAWADHSIRPNALIALAVDPELFESWQASAIIDRVRRELLTPRGIRSLSTADRNYIGQFGASLEEYEAAYHQGSAWPHLLGFFTRAAVRLTEQDEDTMADLRKTISGLVDGGLLLGNVAQLSTGDAPFRPRGSPAYAAAVAELLRVLREDLDSGKD
jgi:predicted glycogen debranching enzyme